ncbi:MAG: leucyl/phenylalanyl-tRNA--protein transferase [Candidatus Hydrogenedens sp.]|nr:leucyl/phenylalanyl-tRNA--protein transferase [Candidatus Hydrogenedens sp.]
MPVFALDKRLAFPPPELAEDGLLAVGGDLSVPRLLLAYRSGIFPWFNEGDPILWHSPDPRAVITAESLHVSRRLARTLRQGVFETRSDTVFEQVVKACAATPRRDQDGTWITQDMIDAYAALHREGYAHSIETWSGGRLVGGLYGVSIGRCFFGESMFSCETDASKVALVRLLEFGQAHGIDLFDCQLENPHLLSMGAYPIARAKFLKMLQARVDSPTLRGLWRLT